MTIPELIKAGQAFRGESDQYAGLITELADALAATLSTLHERELHHFEVEHDMSLIWDDVSSALQTPPDDITVPEYRRQVIAEIARRRKDK